MSTEQLVIPTGQLKQVKLSDITVPDRFRVDYGDMDAFCESIKDKGILQPITLSPNMTLLAGGRRFKGATMAGLEKIPALIRKVDGEIDSREIELVENIFRKDFTWQEEANLIAKIDSLYKEKNLDWSGRKTAQLLSKSKTDVARTLELAKAINVLPEIGEQRTASDAYKMLKNFEETVIVDEMRKRQEAAMNPEAASSGEHIAPLSGYSLDLKTRLKIADSNYNIGDTFKGLVELASEGMVHLIECDPPYGIDLATVKSGAKDSPSDHVHQYEEVPKDEYDKFLNTLATELFRVANRDCWLVFWFGPTWHTEVKAALEKAGWLVDDIPAIWVKQGGQTIQPEYYFARCYEPFFLCRKGQPIMAKRGRSNIFDFPTVPAGAKIHPTERPMPLIEELVATLALPGQVVLVPFLGSGNTLRACYKQKMPAFGWDMNPAYKNKFMLAVEEDARILVSQFGTTVETT